MKRALVLLVISVSLLSCERLSPPGNTAVFDLGGTSYDGSAVPGMCTYVPELDGTTVNFMLSVTDLLTVEFAGCSDGVFSTANPDHKALVRVTMNSQSEVYTAQPLPEVIGEATITVTRYEDVGGVIAATFVGTLVGIMDPTNVKSISGEFDVERSDDTYVGY